MAEKAEKIASRLPQFYMYREKGSSVWAIVSASGKRMDEAEKEHASIMRSHWADTAFNTDLDRLGALLGVARRQGEPDNDYRGRIKTAIISYKGGGTPESIRMVVRKALGLPQDFPLAIKENPQVRRKKTHKVSAGKEWQVKPLSVEPATPDIELSVATEGSKIADPVLTNLSTGESVMFKGNMKFGDKLEIKEGKAFLNGADKTSKLSGAVSLPRAASSWKYTESIGANAGAFDNARFDTSVFAVDIVSDLTMEWTASQPATFELHVPGDALKRAGVTSTYVQGLLDSMKAGGVKAILKVI